MCVHNAAQFDPAELKLLHSGVLDALLVRLQTRDQAIHVKNAVDLHCRLVSCCFTGEAMLLTIALGG